MAAAFDVLIADGLWFDGTGSPGRVTKLGISGGRVAAVGDDLEAGPDTEVVDANGKWVMPGFIDVHTHYDAEVLVAPGLNESVRHGVTTVLLGNCSLSTVFTNPLDAADLFSRVEALPRQQVLEALTEKKNWHNPSDYIEAIEALPLGPNIASMLGHSDVRAAVMGLGRSTDPDQQPTKGELDQMERHLKDALDAGYLGLSTMTNPWDKVDGDRYRSRQLPSSYAKWSEFRRLNKTLRKRGRILQGIPNLNTKFDILFFLGFSTGIGRKPLKVSLLAAADPKSDKHVHKVFGKLAALVNNKGNGQFRWQHLPTKFEVYADGIDLVVFEEFGSGRAALHLKDELERNNLLQDEAYRRWFRADFEKKFTSRVWHRDFDDAEIVGCPDPAVVGKSIGQVARDRKLHPVDAFLDLVVEHGQDLRWNTTIANARPEKLNYLVNQPGVTIGFSDAGAHLRNMAFYNYAIRLLTRMHQANESFISKEKAVYKLTGEIGDFYGLDAGHLRVGDRADIVVIDPTGLNEDTEKYAEAVMPEFGGMSRMVNRNDHAVAATLVGGTVVYRSGEFTEGYGRTMHTGRFLRAGEPRGTVREPQFPSKVPLPG
jgi:N-acyl-D-aspartate/D-glutamate deacylase